MGVGRRPVRIGPLAGPLLAVAAVASLFLPRILDYAFGVVFLAGAAYGLWVSSRRATEDRPAWGLLHPVPLVGFFGLFGGGSIAWGWLTASRVTAGVIGLALLAPVVAMALRRRPRDVEAEGCGLILLLFAATGWLGLFPTYFEQTLWPPTPAGGTVRGLAGYLAVWLGGLLFVGPAYALASREAVGGRPVRAWAAGASVVFALVGFGAWIGGALYFCEAVILIEGRP
jgi:hypothetical protein